MDAVTARVNIDLSAIEDGRTTLDGEVLYDHNGQPEALELDLTGASSTTLNRLLCGTGMSLLDGLPIEATLADGRTVKSSIAFAHGPALTHTGSITLRARLGSSEIVAPARADARPALWQFRLSNVRLSLGDEVTHHPLPPGADPSRTPRGITLNKLRFSAAGQEWVLIDELMGALEQEGQTRCDRPPRDRHLGDGVSSRRRERGHLVRRR
jgi:hypothetical protein